MPWKVLLIELGCFVLFFYLRYLIDQHKLIVFGNYEDNPGDYGEGIANMIVYIYNLAFLIGLFLITQLVFWAFFTARFHSINNGNSKEDADIDDLFKSKS